MAGWAGEALVTGAPYSGIRTTTTQQTLSNGNVISRQEQAKIYRDSQGRVRVEQTSTNTVTGKTHTAISITDPVAGVTFMLNPETKTYTRSPSRMFARPAAAATDGSARPGRARAGVQGQSPAGRARGGAQVQSEDLGAQSIEGQPATGKRMTETIAAGEIGNLQPIQIVRETWVSTSLKIPVMIKTSDPRFGATTMQLTNVVAGEPDAALFQPPADFTPAGGRAGRNMARRPQAQ